MRTAFIDQLIIEAENNPRIFLIVGDLGYSVVEPFAEKFPNRFLNAGVAEQNMTGIAAGLAMEGFTVFTYSIGNFPTMRAMEQVRYDVCYHDLNVIMVTVGGGFAYGPLGASHHATEDLAMLRVLPGLKVAAPGDPWEARRATTWLCQNGGPGYLRLGKAGEPSIHKDLAIFEEKPGAIQVLNGNDTVVLTTGSMLAPAYDWITNNKMPWGLASFPVIKPLDMNHLIELEELYPNWITMEEHQKAGGFGSLILESLNLLRNQNKITTLPKIDIKGIDDCFLSFSGSQTYLRKKAGIILP